MGWLVLCVLVGFVPSILGQEACSTIGLYRYRGTFGIDLTTVDEAPHGTEATLVCNKGSRPGDWLTVLLVDDPTIKCVDGYWEPHDLYYCFLDCDASLLERAVGEWTITDSNLVPVEQAETYPHQYLARITCPDTHFMANKNRKIFVDLDTETFVGNTETQPPAYCLNGEWIPIWDCWSKEEFGEPEQATVAPDVVELVEDVENERRLALQAEKKGEPGTEVEATTEAPESDESTEDYSDDPCYTYELFRHRGSFGIDLEQETVPVGTKGTLVCDPTGLKRSRPGNVVANVLASDPTIECISGQWEPWDTYYCFKDCTIKDLHRDVGAFLYYEQNYEENILITETPPEGFLPTGTMARIQCPDTHFSAEMNKVRIVKSEQPKSHCINGEWLPQYHCFDKTEHELQVVTMDPFLKQFWKELKNTAQEELDKQKEKEKKLLDATPDPVVGTVGDPLEPPEVDPTEFESEACSPLMAVDPAEGNTLAELIAAPFKDFMPPTLDIHLFASEPQITISNGQIQAVCNEGVVYYYSGPGPMDPALGFDLLLMFGQMESVKCAEGGWWEGVDADGNISPIAGVACMNGEDLNLAAVLLAQSVTAEVPPSATDPPEVMTEEPAATEQPVSPPGTEEPALTEIPVSPPGTDEPVVTGKPVKPTEAASIDEPGKAEVPKSAIIAVDGSVTATFVGVSQDGVSCELHSDCHSVNFAPKELVCDWDAKKHAWAAGVRLPKIPIGCFCDKPDGVFTVKGTGKCVISRMNGADSLQWAYCNENIYEKCG